MSAPTVDSSENLSLAERLCRRILKDGSISFRDWMEAALYDEREGYYRRKGFVRRGRAGDYRTAPERSPLFAETFARAFAAFYEELGAPPEWTILEAGAGEGHFARGVLESLERNYPRVFAATRYLIDEVCEDAYRSAQDLLAPFAGHVEFRSLAEIKLPFEGIVFSNELMDAFPVHRVRMREGKLFELGVGVSAGGDFIWTEFGPAPSRLKEHFESLNVRLEEGQTAEINLTIEDWLAQVTRVLKRGFLVTVDYGAEAADLYCSPHRREGTLRAFSKHRLVENALMSPGRQDLTTTIDWTHVKMAGARLGFSARSFERLDQFLLRAGVLEELERAPVADEAERVARRVSAREMIMPTGMAASFQVLVLKKSV